MKTEDTVDRMQSDFSVSSSYETVGDLLEKLKYLSGVIKKNTIVPITEYIKFENGQMVATNLHITLGCETNITGWFLVPFDKLYKILSKLKNKESKISFTVQNEYKERPDGKEEHLVTVGIMIDGKDAFQIASESAIDFPEQKDDFSIPSGQLSPSDINLLIQATLFCAKDELRPAMVGVYLEQDRAVSTDGNAMFYPKLDNTIRGNMIVPADAVKLLAGLDDTVGKGAGWQGKFVYANATQVKFTNHSRFIISRLIDKRFPAYQSVIPQSTSFQLDVDKEHLKEMVGMALIVADKRSKCIKFRYDNGAYYIASEDANLDEKFFRQITTTHSSETEFFSFAFNGDLLLRAINVIEGDTVTIRGSKPNRVFVINENQLMMPILTM